MKILSIGNSFSQDAHKWLHSLAAANGVELEAVNLCIGGCSLERHWTNVADNLPAYELERNGVREVCDVRIADVLEQGGWDVITLQQVSHLSGMPESYEPYLADLTEVVRRACPGAELYFHQTWAYDPDSDHGGFANYHNDQREMYDCIVRTTARAARSIRAELIPSGTVIQRLREKTAEFDYANGGRSLCRDGFHMSLDYGRYAVAATWLRTLTGIDVAAGEFEDFDVNLLKTIVGVVNEL